MKKIVILFCCLTGCAVFRGQAKYTGKAVVPTITERIVRFPEMPHQGMRSGEIEHKENVKKALANYWDLPADKAAEVDNPLEQAIDAHLYCYSSFPSTFDFVIPAHTSQQVLFTTNAAHMYDTLCELREYEVINANR